MDQIITMEVEVVLPQGQQPMERTAIPVQEERLLREEVMGEMVLLPVAAPMEVPDQYPAAEAVAYVR
jgi:hypothetical protein